ncbi:hypothetical protein SK128_020554 [Halocaridina rubra]|uniref:Glucose-methanol-choline oxidoreductase N-terminal domain-containing protein n=1 Tax=Halocaridina rubra TaxID=373956 RepID=A0AAN8XIX1_HALRR
MAPESIVPAFNLFLFQGDHDWKYRTLPKRNVFKAFQDNAIPYPRGLGAGGSSSVNSMIYLRGHKNDYDHWESLGNTGWAYEDVLKYFIKAENYLGSRYNKTASYHGFGGPLSVDDQRWKTPVADAFLQAGQQMGFPIIDPSGPESIGFAPIDLTSRNGRRASTADAYLNPAAEARKNLHVLLKAYVTKVRKCPFLIYA